MRPALPLQSQITELLGPFGPVIVIGLLGVILIGVAVMIMIKQGQDPLDRLKRSNREEKKKGKGKGDQTDRLRSGGRSDKLDKYATFLEPQDEEQLSQIRVLLMQAGYRNRDAVRFFHFAQLVLGVGFLVVGFFYYVLFVASDTSTTQDMVVAVLAPGVIGYMLPKMWVNKRKKVRLEEISDGFPDALDLMLVCIEAGQALDQTIVRVATELRISYPSLAEEFEIMSQQTKAGQDKATVYHDLAERCDLQDINSFVTVLIQSQNFGTSIADALRVYASEMRDKRIMRAEEKANKVPTKMTLATMMFTVPPLLIILVGPSVLGIMELFALTASPI